MRGRDCLFSNEAVLFSVLRAAYQDYACIHQYHLMNKKRLKHVIFQTSLTGNNDNCHLLGDYLGMTLPIVTVVRTDENHSVVSSDVTVAYFLPAEHQAQPPLPTDSEILIEIWPTTTVYTRSVRIKQK